MQDILGSTLQRLLKEIPKKFPHVREQTSTVLEQLSSSPKSVKLADAFIEPLLSACGTRVPKLVLISLECLQRLSSGGFVDGSQFVEEDQKYGLITLIEKVVIRVCECEDTEGKFGPYSPDDAIQLQVIKTLQSAVTYSKCGVHEAALLAAVRTCYHIYLYSRNSVNKTTAKASLTQLLNTVYQSMEKQEAIEIRSGGSVDHSDINIQGIDIVASEAIATPPLRDSVTESDENEESDNDTKEEDITDLVDAVVNEMIANVTDQITPEPVTPTTSEEAKPATEEPPTTPRTMPNERSFAPFPSIQHKDAYLIFRALCKLSVKNQQLVDGDSTTGGEQYVPDPIALRSKLLSLDLILSILENAGESFNKSRDFVFAIKSYLIPSLVKNSVSSSTQIVVVSLRIFSHIQKNFSSTLQTEIGLVISEIYLPMIESSNSPYEHKLLILEVIGHICNDVEVLSNIFLTYDCDMNHVDLYARIVGLLSRIAGDPVVPTNRSSGVLTPEEERRASQHMLALNCIGSLLGKMAEYRDAAVVETNAAEEDEEPTSQPTSPAHQESRGAESTSRSVSIDNDGKLSSRKQLAMESYQQKQRYKRDLETAASKFAVKPRRGLDYLVEQGYIQDTPESFAQALMQFQDTLDKTQIGEFLGTDKPFNVDTLYAYVDMFKFEGMSIDIALRKFLSGFRIPGEAQKIDRMMEKFAARFFEDNAELFPSADTPYVLAFAIIMLNTDLHNPNIPVERKMTKEGFIKQNRGIAGGRDLDPDYLCLIFDRIKESPISLKEDDGARERLNRKARDTTGGMFFRSSKESTSRKQRAAFSKERQNMVSTATSILGQVEKSPAAKAATLASLMSPKQNPNATDQSSSVGDGNSAKDDHTEIGDILDTFDHIEPMFDVTWAPFFALFSRNMQITNDSDAVNICISAMKSAIHIASTFHMEHEQQTLLNGLIQFTFLNSSTHEMKAKNISCAQALIHIIQQDGNLFSETCWQQSLMCLSELSRLQQTANTIPTSTLSSVSSLSTQSSSNNGDATRRRPSPSISEAAGGASILSYFQNAKTPEEQARATELDNAAKLVKSFDMVQIDRVFMDSVSLSSTAIIDMVSALCAVSRNELQKPNPTDAIFPSLSGMTNKTPRIFSLQKLVEVSDFNMRVRPRFVWSRVWNVLSTHFTLAGCHEDIQVSMYAVDSLRQLSVKFLKREELAGFSFQSQFMQPFGNMMARSKTRELRDLVLRCLQNIVLSAHESLKSGWSVILEAVAEGAREIKNIELNLLALEILQYIIKEHMATAEESYFGDVVKCVVAFLTNSSIPAVKATPSVKLLENLFADVIQQPEPITLEKLEKLWPVLQGLVLLISDNRNEIKSQSLESLFRVLENHACRFDSNLWMVLYFRLILPLFGKVTQKLQPMTRVSYHRILLKRAALVQSRTVESTVPAVVPIPLKVVLDQASIRDIVFKHVDLIVGFFNDDYISNQVHPDDFDTEVWKTGIMNEFLPAVFPHLFLILEWLALSDLEYAARVGVSAMSRLIVGAGEHINTEEWSITCAAFADVLSDTIPRDLSNEHTRSWVSGRETLLPVEHSDLEDEAFVFYQPKTGSALPFKSALIDAQCSVQVQMLQLLGNVLPSNFSRIDEQDILSTMQVVYNCSQFARDFNEDLAYRIELYQKGYTHDHNRGVYPTLLSQEALALTRYINFLFRVHAEYETRSIRFSEDSIVRLEHMLEDALHSVFMHFLFQDRMISAGKDGNILDRDEKADMEHDFEVCTPVVLLSLREVLDWEVTIIKRHISWLYPLLTALLDCGSREVHTLLRQIFDTHISVLLGLDIKSN